jgi:hypothetical protein
VSRGYPFGKSGIGDSGVPLTKTQALALKNPHEP